MHEEDHLDRMLDSSLSSYGDPGPDTGMESGLAERILARVSSEQRSDRSAPRWHSRFLLWAALTVAAGLLLTLSIWKPAGSPAIHHASTEQPDIASVTPKSQNPTLVTPAQKRTTSTIRRTPVRPSVAAAESARPKLSVFPLPQPLSPEERALYAFATQVPEKQRQAILDAQKNVDAPLNIAAIHIQPLGITDTGKN